MRASNGRVARAAYVAEHLAKNAAARVVLPLHPGRGSYGMDGDVQAVAAALELLEPGLRRLERPIDGAHVLELGPGRTPEMAGAFVLAGAARATGVDVKLQIGPEALDPSRYKALAEALTTDRTAPFLEAVGSGPAAVRARYRELAASVAWPAQFLDYGGDRIPLEDGSIDLAFSKSVLEHVPLDTIPRLLFDLRRVLRPGAMTVHWIDLRDHLHILDDADATGDWLEALRHPRRLFDAMFSHRSTSINRLRSPQWRDAFEAAGLEVLEWQERRYPLPPDFRPDLLQPPWRGYDLETLSVAQVCVAARRPG